MEESDIKSRLYRHCSNFINSKIKEIESGIRSLQNDLETEAKSSAGDKHETGRAMLHLEIEKASQQLVEGRKTLELLKKMDYKKTSDKAGSGSLVITNSGKFFLSISLGQIKIDQETFYAVSPLSPIGRCLIGKNAGSTVQFNNRTIQVLEVQ